MYHALLQLIGLLCVRTPNYYAVYALNIYFFFIHMYIKYTTARITNTKCNKLINIICKTYSSPPIQCARYFIRIKRGPNLCNKHFFFLLVPRYNVFARRSFENCPLAIIIESKKKIYRNRMIYVHFY